MKIDKKSIIDILESIWVKSYGDFDKIIIGAEESNDSITIYTTSIVYGDFVRKHKYENQINAISSKLQKTLGDSYKVSLTQSLDIVVKFVGINESESQNIKSYILKQWNPETTNSNHILSDNQLEYIKVDKRDDSSVVVTFSNKAIIKYQGVKKLKNYLKELLKGSKYTIKNVDKLPDDKVVVSNK